ncbi:MAG: FadR family transcriptional regulator [Aquamicrobium sp.]|uniref:FadR/GntR family transcriptional regulator n=1 Tax=Mesorhizobium TaxID=68287 RepID=UPI0013EE0CC7|nr:MULTISPECIES: FadR/GntR family transcriptional regulator [Mesorhizobium]MBR2691080.1 FadR family transcriptional regulator [Aquamicrobium sp.]
MQEGTFSGVEPLKKAGLTEILVSRILGLVTAGNLKPGDHLPPERNLAETFQVSRPTVREAVRALAVLGVLEIRHGGGIIVSQLSAADLLKPLTFFLTLQNTEVDKLYEARELIEGDIAARAAANASPDDVAFLEQLIADQEAATETPVTYREVDTAFHRRLAELAENEFLARAAQSLNILGLEFRKIASETPGVINRSIQDHKAIVAAFRAKDTEAARGAMVAHMRNVLRSTRESMRAGDKS